VNAVIAFQNPAPQGLAKPPGAQKHRIFDFLKSLYVLGFIDKVAVFGYNLLVIGYTIQNTLFHGNILLKV
jgi:hypothetical protein